MNMGNRTSCLELKTKQKLVKIAWHDEEKLYLFVYCRALREKFCISRVRPFNCELLQDSASVIIQVFRQE